MSKIREVAKEYTFLILAVGCKMVKVFIIMAVNNNLSMLENSTYYKAYDIKL